MITISFIAILFFINTLLTVLVLTWYLRRNIAKKLHRIHIPFSYQRTHKRAPQSYNIALIVPEKNQTTSTLHKEMERALSNIKMSGAVDLFIGNRLNHLTEHHVRYALKEKYDVIVPVGLFCSQITQEIASKRGRTPVIFTNIKNEEQAVLQTNRPDRNITGVITKRDLASQIKQLLKIKPGMSSALIIHSNSAINKKEVIETQNILSQHGVSTSLCPTLKNTLFSKEHVASLSKETPELIIELEGALSPEQVEQVGYVSNEIEALFCVSNEHTVKRGAAIGFERSQKQIAELVVDKIKAVTQHDITPHELAKTVTLESYQIILNPKVFEAQKVAIPKEVIFLIKNGIIQTD